MLNPRQFSKDEGGATAIEYGLIAALIAIAVIGGMTFFADRTVDMWGYVSNNLISAS